MSSANFIDSSRDGLQVRFQLNAFYDPGYPFYKLRVRDYAIFETSADVSPYLSVPEQAEARI
jgi:hypothetical protein